MKKAESGLSRYSALGLEELLILAASGFDCFGTKNKNLAFSKVQTECFYEFLGAYCFGVQLTALAAFGADVFLGGDASFF